jgi:predicted phage baseplate assembly protein
VQVYGNVVSASRGETVPAEVLGSGDASFPNQSFVLQKKPLTYLPSPSAQNEWGAVSTLDIYVDGLRWTEVASFFGVAPDAQIYVVRQRDDGTSAVTFGDGVNGARLPSGVDNVMATYRFGGGAASPPAFSVKQVVRPVPRLKSMVNPVAAAGGEDAELPESLRKRAPKGALLLGRAVSIQDFEAAANAVGGVRLASAQWGWQPERQRPGVQVWYIGAASLAAFVSQRLRSISDPSRLISVTQAVAVPASLALGLHTDPRRDAAVVVAAVRALLLAPGTGLLEPEQLGIGRPLFRSRIMQTVLAVPGTVAVSSVTWNGMPFSDYGQTAGAGRYFDFESGGLAVSGSPFHG